MKPEHPMQQIEIDDDGRDRFRENAIVRHLLDNGGIDLNDIGRLPFDDQDHRQFAQLIGYSVHGWASLSYVRDTDAEVADAVVNYGEDPRNARTRVLEEKLISIKAGVREGVAELFDVHPEFDG